MTSKAGPKIITCVASDLLSALEIAASVRPRAITVNGDTGFVVAADVAAGGRVYSVGESSTVACPFVVREASDGVALVLPPAVRNSLRSHGDGLIKVSCLVDRSTCSITIAGPGGSSSFKTPSPASLRYRRDDPPVADDAFGKPIPAGILRAALVGAHPFVSKDGKAEPETRTIQIFDSANPSYSKGDGTLYASDGISAYYFYSSAFVGRAMTLHADDLDVAIKLTGYAGTIRAAAGNEPRLLSDVGTRLWGSRCKPREQYNYYPRKVEGYRYTLARAALVSMIQEAVTPMRSDRPCVRLLFEHRRRTLRIEVAAKGRTIKSHAIPILRHAVLEDRDIDVAVVPHMMFRLLETAQAPEVELRLMLIPPPEGRPREGFTLRTIEHFWADAEGRVVAAGNAPQPTPDSYECRVTAFVTGEGPAVSVPIGASNAASDSSK